MKLKKLFANIPVQVYRGGLDLTITGLSAHSSRVAPGHLFIARRGQSSDGAQYIQEAVAAGASAILTDLPNPFLKKEIVQLLHPQIQLLEGPLAARFYGDPARSLYMVGITGTNGKTTTNYLIKHLFDHLNLPCGLIGTVEYLTGNQRFPAERTTPDALTTQKFLKEMVKQGCRAATLEVSSHGLAQGRCDQIAFDLALFTNLSQDHLDYHKTLENYADEKAKLFSRLPRTSVAIVNHESPWKERMVRDCQARVLSYGFSREATLYADNIRLSPQKTEFCVHYEKQQAEFSWQLIGRFNILNCLAAIAAALIATSEKISLSQFIPLIACFSPVPGRLERVGNQKGLAIFVDYAHTPDALEQVLTALQEFTPGRLITVFGCGGDRDSGKRPQMGRIAEKKSLFTWITSDNPRSENPQTICLQIAAGFSSQSNYAIVIDRREAIHKAIAMMTPQDCLLIAGKGHEREQIFGQTVLPFDDRSVAEEKLKI